MLPFLWVSSVKKKSWKRAWQTQASGEIHLLKKEQQQEGVYVKEKAERGDCVTIDHYKTILAWYATSPRNNISEGKNCFLIKNEQQKDRKPILLVREKK